MKIKTIFILFNGIVLLFLMTIVFAFGTGDGVRLLDWRLWALAALCLLVLICLDVYYFLNMRVLSLLEKKNWSGLAQYLEVKVLGKGHFSSRSVGLLAQAYLVLSDTTAVVNLENKTALAKPRLIEEHALLFGMARLLEKNMANAAHFFAARIRAPKPNKKDMCWLRFYYGFTMLLDWHFPEACDEFILQAKISDTPLVTGLAAWFLDDYLAPALPDRRDEIEAAVEIADKRVHEVVYDLKQWQSKTAKILTQPHAAVIAQYVKKAGNRLFPRGAAQ